MPIRSVEPTDARGIATAHARAWQVAYRGLLPDDVLHQISVDSLEKHWCGTIADPPGPIFVAEHEGQIAGFATCGPCRDEDLDPETVGEVYGIYVHPEHWRRGHGTALMNAAIGRLCEYGLDIVVLWVLSGNVDAMRFYEAVGFRPDGASKMRRRADGLELPVVRYWKHPGWFWQVH